MEHIGKIHEKGMQQNIHKRERKNKVEPKINFDASVLRDGSVALGHIFRDHSGRVVHVSAAMQVLSGHFLLCWLNVCQSG